MMEWNAERRAAWLYHNQHNIERSAYERGLQDAAVAAEVARLKAANTSVNEDYVDPEFAEDPSVMYSDEYVEAAYNPTVVEGSYAWTIFIWLVVIGVIGLLAFLLIFRTRFGS